MSIPFDILLVMLIPIYRYSLGLFFLLFFSAPLFSATYLIQPLQSAPKLDAHIRVDPIWKDIPSVGSFYQHRPHYGQKMFRRTVVRLGYTDDALYGAIICQVDPNKIRFIEGKRDSDIVGHDYFKIMIDSAYDRQSGVYFATTPTGIKVDGSIRDNGALIDPHWNGEWEVVTTSNSREWRAEFRIPFETLKYAGIDKQTWGINFERHIVSRSELGYWSLVGIHETINRVSSAGSLVGIKPGFQPHFTITPYGLGQYSFLNQDQSLKSGLDLKYQFSSKMNLELTANTDFSQIVFDDQKMDLDGYSLYYDEKRPFFLQDSHLFSVGEYGVKLFHSRRIGISNSGKDIPIQSGARLMGNVKGVNVGSMVLSTQGVDGVSDPQTYQIHRFQKPFLGGSTVGFLLTDRRSALSSYLPESNQLKSIDGVYRLDSHQWINWFVANTDTSGYSDSQDAVGATYKYQSPLWEFELAHSRIGEHFDPQVGYLKRSFGYFRSVVSATRRFRVKHSTILEHQPYIYHWNYTKLPHVLSESGTSYGYRQILVDGSNYNFILARLERILSDDYTIAPFVQVPQGYYKFYRFTVQRHSPKSDDFYLSQQFRLGQLYNGQYIHYIPNLRWRYSAQLSLSVGWEYLSAVLSGGGFTTHILNVSPTYQFSNSLGISSKLQFNSAMNLAGMNIILSWYQSANAGLFLIFKDIRDVSISDWDIKDQSVMLKYSKSMHIKSFF